jgi:hypothetical protein
MPVEVGPSWFKMPNNLFRSGMAAKVGKMGTLLLACLCEFANGEGENTFTVSDKQLASVTGMGTRTISDARKRLVEFRFIDCKRGDGQSYTYTLLPVSMQYLRLEHRLRKKDKPRGLHGGEGSANVA